MFTLRSLPGIALWLGLLLAPLAALADPPEGSLYRGYVGAYDIVACIQPEDDEGRYYLLPTQQGVDRAAGDERAWVMERIKQPAAKTVTDGDLTGTWQFSREGSCCASDLRASPVGQPIRDHMTLTRDGAGSWRGVYRQFASDDNTVVLPDQVPIHLRWSDVDCSDFENQRLAPPWIAGEPAQVMAAPPTRGHPLVLFEVQSLTHPVTGVKSVRLLPGPHLSASVADAINTQLMKIVEDMNRELAGCVPSNGNVQLKFATRRLVVVEASFDINCRGAHVNEDSRVHSFDLQTGQPIVFENWLRGAEVPKPLLAKALKVAKSEHGDDHCVDRMRENQAFMLWVASTGMQFRYIEYVRSLIHCRGDYAAPFIAVRPFIDKSHRKTFDAFVRSFHQ